MGSTEMSGSTKAPPKAINFTKAALEAVAPPPEDRIYLKDAKVPGLRFCVTSNDARAFYLYRKVNGKPERIRLGGFPELTVEQARTKATELNGQIALGINPNAHKRAARAESTLKDLWVYFRDQVCKPFRKPKTWLEYEKQYKKHLEHWQNRKLSDITQAAVITLHQKIGKSAPYMANRILALLSAMFNKAGRIGYTGANPAEGVERFAEKSRKRFLDADEFARFWTALADEQDETLRDFFKIAVLTGARRGNVQAMRWEQLDLDAGVWIIPETKSDEDAVVYLSGQAVEVLKTRRESAEKMKAGPKRERATEWVFPSYGKTGHLTEPKGAWAKVLERAKLKDLRIHDLRRTLGSWQAMTGASLPIIGKSLGHKSQQATAVYARLNITPVKASVDLATEAMLGAVEQAKAKSLKGGNK